LKNHHFNFSSKTDLALSIYLTLSGRSAGFPAVHLCTSGRRAVYPAECR